MSYIRSGPDLHDDGSDKLPLLPFPDGPAILNLARTSCVPACARVFNGRILIEDDERPGLLAIMEHEYGDQAACRWSPTTRRWGI